MLRHCFRVVLRMALVAAMVVLLVRLVRRLRATRSPAVDEVRSPAPVSIAIRSHPVWSDASPTPPAWVSSEEGVCPPSYPVKVKLSSGLFHLPGMSAYERTHPDRCYRDAEAAIADGFTRAKR